MSSAITTSVPPEALTSSTRLLAREVAIDLDLLDFAGDDGLLFARDGLGFAGRGEALRLRLPRGLADSHGVTEILRRITRRGDDVGVAGGPVALGALPFVPTEEGSLIVPAVLAVKDGDGTVWITRTGPGDSVEDCGFHLPAPRSTAWSPSDFDLRTAMPHDQWCALIAATVDRINHGDLDKVVLARAIDVTADGPIVVGDVLERLRTLFPSCTVFSIEGFVGASPELLVGRLGDQVAAHPLAGTVARSGDPDDDARRAAGLLASSKDRWEHALTIDAVAAVLRPLCHALDVPEVPSIVALRNVSHLGTYVRGQLRPPLPSSLDLVAALHPTPAVGGVPTDKALALIEATEPHGRGRYAGPVGWIDAAGNGEWMVGLRSAQISGNRARMMAGGGIVADSDPKAELAETQFKFQALLAAIVRP